MQLRDLLKIYIVERPNLSNESAKQIAYTLNNFERFLSHAPRIGGVAAGLLFIVVVEIVRKVCEK